MASGRIERIEHTADVAVRISADDLPALFDLAAQALYQVIGHLVGQGESQTHRITLSASSVEDLFHDWLAELLYRFDVRQQVFDGFEFDVLTKHTLDVRATGRKFDADTSEIRTEIKAVTYHNLKIERCEDQFVVTVVLDV